MLPDTTTQGRGGRGRTGLLLAACLLAALIVAVALAFGRQDFSPGEEIEAPGVEDIAVSPEAGPYPESDSLRLGGDHRVVYVYVRVEGLAAADGLGRGWSARAGRRRWYGSSAGAVSGWWMRSWIGSTPRGAGSPGS